MKKLRIILQSKILILFLISITTIVVLINTNKKSFNSNKLGSNKTITGIITNISFTEYNKVLEIEDTVIYTNFDTDFLLGQKIECTGIVSLPKQNTNFYLFNYRNYLKSKKIFYQMEAECIVLKEKVAVIHIIKNSIINRIEKLKSKGYLKSFILGTTSDINNEVLNNYRNNGISHLLAISGMHVSFLVGLFTIFKRKYLLFLILIFYLFLANFPISMIRAVIFFILVMINKKTKLNLSTIILFIYFTIFILWWNPYLVYSTGFLYSFIISFYLILFSKIFNNKNKILSIWTLPLVVFLITIPINMMTNFSLNLLSPIYNIIFVPIVSIILFPISFLVFMFPILDNGYYFVWTALEEISANLLSINIVFCYISFYIFILYYLIITFILHKLTNKEYKYIGLIFIILLFHYFYPNFRDYGFIQMLDIGQGDSIIVSYPRNKLNILIDTGGTINNERSRYVNNITIPTLYSLGIKKLDYLIITHGDADHAGEAIELLKNIKVNKVLFNSGKITELESDIINYLNKNKIEYSFISEEIITHNNIKLYFINATNYDNENEDSLILLLKIKNFISLFMGDSGISSEKKILEEYNLSSVDILKVGHHGSKNSSSEYFINSVNPRIALISAGKNNLYGHPHKEVLNNLHFCDTYITSTHGAIKVRIDKDVLVTKVR